MKMKNLLIVLILFFTLAKCKTIEELTDFNNPEVSSSYPANNEMGVPNNAIITLKFSEEMNKASVEDNLSFTDAAGTAVDKYISWSGSKTVRITPAREMTTGIRYKVVVGEAAKDRGNNKLNIPYILMFTVNPDNTKPAAIIDVEGYVGATAVGFPYIPSTQLQPSILIRFSEAMDREQTISAISADSMKIAYQWLDSNENLSNNPQTDMILRLLLTEELQYGKKYKITVSESAKDLAGNGLYESKTLNFYVGNDFVFPQITDITVQQNGSAVPVSIANQTNITRNVSNTTDVIVSFSRAMDPLSVSQALKISPSVDTSFNWDATNTQLTIVLEENEQYEFGKQVSVTLGKDSADSEGNSLLEEYKRLFIIGDNLEAPKINTITVEDSNGADLDLMDGQIDQSIPLKPTFVVTFSRKMDHSLVQSSISFSPTVKESNISLNWSDLGNPDILAPEQVTIVIDEELVYGSLYELSISSTAKDVNGNLSLDKSYKVSFYVGIPGDYLAVDNVEYFNQENTNYPVAEVPINPIIKVHFNKPIELTSLLGSISFTPSFNVPSNQISLEGDRIVVIDINHNVMDKLLTPSTLYQLILSKGIYAADNFKTPMSENAECLFSTGAEEKIEVENLSMIDRDHPAGHLYVQNTVLNFLTDEIDPEDSSITVRIDFSTAYLRDTLFDNISIKRTSGGSLYPYISDYNFVDENSIVLTISNIEYSTPDDPVTTDVDEKDKVYYLLEIKGDTSGIRSNIGHAMQGSITIEFKTIDQ